MTRFVRDRTPQTLTAWQLSNDIPGTPGALPVNIGSEFAGYDAPKLKFLFTLSFELGETLEFNQGSDDMGQIVYACKSASRPNINVNYVEVNSYNYRYKVATRTDVGTVTVTFYDDNKNTAHAILQGYLNAISPVSNKERGTNYYLKDDIQQWASLGPLPQNDADGLIKSMRITQHYNSGYSSDPSYFSKVHYDYINPKIQQFNWDELDMSASDASMISVTFVYDSVNITVEHNEGTFDGGRVTVNNGNTSNGSPVQNIP
jgi:hypothetical protein